MTTWFNDHLVLWLELLHLWSLGAIGLGEEETLRFKFYMRSHKTAYTKSHVTPWVASCYHTSSPCEGWWYKPCKKRHIKFSIWLVTSCNHVIRVVQLYYGLCLTICQHLAKFGGHTSFSRRNISFLIYHMTSCDQVIEQNMSSWCVHSIKSHQLTKFHGLRPCRRRYVMLLIGHVTTVTTLPKDHMAP